MGNPRLDIASSDLAIVGFLVVLEGLLSADNALVMAIMVLGLPPTQHKQALRYGLYAVVAAAVNSGKVKSKAPGVAADSILKEWNKFEIWAAKRATNSAYKTGTSFDYVNYYKGPTVDSDLKSYGFSI